MKKEATKNDSCNQDFDATIKIRDLSQLEEVPMYVPEKPQKPTTQVVKIRISSKLLKRIGIFCIVAIILLTSVIIIASNRRGYIGDTHWGMKQTEVERTESVQPAIRSSNHLSYTNMKNSIFPDLPCQISYEFNSKDQLCKGSLVFVFQTDKEYKEAIDKVVKKYDLKYKEIPSEEEFTTVFETPSSLLKIKYDTPNILTLEYSSIKYLSE